VNQRFEDCVCPRHQGNDDEDRDGAQNVRLLAIQPPDAELAKEYITEFQ